MMLSEYLKTVNEGVNMEVTANLGYVIAPNSIRRCLRLSQEEKMLLLEIYSLYNEKHKCAYPTQQTLAIYLGISSSTVSKHLHKLEEKGFIIIKGRKCTKKRYVPSFQIHLNPYILLSEWTHFVINEVRHHIPESIGGEWANKFLRHINVKQSEEFTLVDKYGEFLKRLLEATTYEQIGIRSEFFSYLTDSISKETGVQLALDWKAVLDKMNQRKDSKFRKKSNGGYATTTSNNLELDDDDVSVFDDY
ncbi:helix-turn-helix domain-containing protein [Aneurinibacillus sp. Ricciae_BoGa-3]|uniref:helix-turn-helix domain-containing protein n=1 Tax=Aneurinibacillus sp. Ricciae_BoGa-3 TaxID=3022697 RepID=UPI0023412C7A|nr:helix-turn-helix domain-containing protein [Aneurinibacillus sp. Ricciae_BoGa-3]WCK53440.1 helix-turn-helix domain-containing protein [Aneurinibacillus sp. Ricciae_BoGa-3]